MSSNDLTRDVEQWAEEVANRAKALVPCDRHMHVLLRRGGEEAERRAYAFAQTDVGDGVVSFPQSLVSPAVKSALEQGVVSCDPCASDRS
ncbi:hypothetical protein GCM10011393_03320 [Sphingopyxis bauzanensis]|nr:hypothetical protein GCM10011393_03320 [Sphingopyxis bauzanensis]